MLEPVSDIDVAVPEHRPKQEMKHPTTRPRWKFRLTLILGGLFAGLMFGEIAVRVFDIGPRFDPIPLDNYRICGNPILRYELVPKSIYRGDPINSAGLRGKEIPQAKPMNTFRIACVGDSTTFGLYVKDAETYPSRLESILNLHPSPDGRRAEVINFGVAGYNINQNVENLRVRALAYSPDAILFGYCMNDPSEYSAEFAVLRNRAGPAKRQYLDNIIHRSGTLAGHSRLFRLGYYAWLTEKEAWGSGANSSPTQSRKAPLRAGKKSFFHKIHEPGAGWDRVALGFEALRATASTVPVYVVVFPILDGLTDDPYIELHARVRALAESHGFQVIDLLEPLREASRNSTEPLALDELHPAPFGNDVVARTVANVLLQSALPVR